jgi:putative nucleotidyltransferase with HDIG domain
MSFNRQAAQTLLEQYVKNPSLRRHCEMVSQAMGAYADKLEKDHELWSLTGLLHDLDWEMFPDEHPMKAVAEILPQAGAPAELVEAIAAHAPARSGQEPHTLMERYLFACDEASGFLDAVAKIRPNGYTDLSWPSVHKKMKDKRFAANVSREDIVKGAKLIELTLDDHISFLIDVFKRG